MSTDTQPQSLESGFDEWYANRPHTREVLSPQGYARMVWRAALKYRAALAAAEAQPHHIPDAGNMVAVPQGFALVPVEPTVGMCIAGDEARITVDDLTRTPAIYRAMISAAPAAPAPVALTPLTPEQVGKLLTEAGYTGGGSDGTRARGDFINGLRHGEVAHGIGGKA